MDTYNDVSSARCLPVLGLISACHETWEDLGQRLNDHYSLRLGQPEQGYHHIGQLLTTQFAGAEAVLVDWVSEGPATLLALRHAMGNTSIPLIALCKPSEAEQVAALVIGADAVLPSPFNPLLLQARIIACQRLARHSTTAHAEQGDGHFATLHSPFPVLLPHREDIYQLGPLTLDLPGRLFYVDNQAIRLTTREFDLMAFLMRHIDICHARDQILGEVWGVDFDTETNILDVQIYNLRRKLKAQGVCNMIQTVRGVGYRLSLDEHDAKPTTT